MSVFMGSKKNNVNITEQNNSITETDLLDKEI